MSGLTLSQIYAAVLTRQPFQVEGLDERSFNNLRTSLLRKFKETQRMFTSVGADSPYSEEFIQCKFIPETGTATFQLAPKVQRKTQPNRWNVTSF